MTYDNLSTADAGADKFGYCDANGGSVTGEYYQACLNCVKASGEANHVANGAFFFLTTVGRSG